MQKHIMRHASEAGIVIGPILFVLALLGVIAMAIANGFSGFSLSGNTDRIAIEIPAQANLIRSKIHECYMQYMATGLNYSNLPCLGDPYPCSNSNNGTSVADLTCPADPPLSGGQPNIWTGRRTAMLPQPPQGFEEWHYMNAGDVGGRCFWTKPKGSKTGVGWFDASKDPAIVEGLTRAKKKFSSQEASYDPASPTQKFVLFITRPAGSPHSFCDVH